MDPQEPGVHGVEKRRLHCLGQPRSRLSVVWHLAERMWTRGSRSPRVKRRVISTAATPTRRYRCLKTSCAMPIAPPTWARWRPSWGRRPTASHMHPPGTGRYWHSRKSGALLHRHRGNCRPGCRSGTGTGDFLIGFEDPRGYGFKTRAVGGWALVKIQVCRYPAAVSGGKGQVDLLNGIGAQKSQQLVQVVFPCFQVGNGL